MKYILIVDDDKHEHILFRYVIQRLYSDIEVSGYLSCSEMVQKLNDLTPTLIFLDINIPMESGIECLRQMRTKPHLAHTPIIIYSNDWDDELVLKAYSAGATYYLPKTIAVNEMENLFIWMIQTCETHLTVPFSEFLLDPQSFK